MIGQLWVRSYVALFHGVGQEEEDLLNFFGNANLCEKMINQGVLTSYLSLSLCDVTRLYLRHEDVDGGRRVIVLQTGVGNNAGEIAIAIEKQKYFTSWMNNIKVSYDALIYDKQLIIFECEERIVLGVSCLHLLHCAHVGTLLLFFSYVNRTPVLVASKASALTAPLCPAASVKLPFLR